MFKKAILLIALAGVSIFSGTAAEEPFAKPQETYCCDWRDPAVKCVDIVKRCDPGAVEISATPEAIIKIGYRYIGKSPVYIRIKNDCPRGTVLPVIAEPSREDKTKNSSLKEQVTEYICGNYEPVKIHFDMQSGLRTFSYYERPKGCSAGGCPDDGEKFSNKWHS